MTRLWRLLMRVLFLKSRPVPMQVRIRLDRYEHERAMRMVGYEAAWQRRWDRKAVAPRSANLWQAR